MVASNNQVTGQSSNSQFGSSSVFGQNTNPNNDPFAAKSFGSQTGSSMPALGASSSPAFGVSSSSFDGSSVYGQMPAPSGFESMRQSSSIGTSFQMPEPSFQSSICGSSPLEVSSQPAFGASSTPAFGSSSTPAFGSSSTPACGASSTPAIGASSTPAFDSLPAPAFGATSSRFSFGSSPAFGQSTSAFGSSPFEKSHEELSRGNQLGDKGGWNPAAQSSGGMGFNMKNTQQPNPFVSSSPAFRQSSTNSFEPKTSIFGTSGFGSSTPSLGSSTFGLAASNPFGAIPSPAPSASGSTSAFGSTTSGSVFGTPSSSACGTSTSIFGTQAQGTTSSFGTGFNSVSTQPSALQSTTPTLGQTSSPFGAPSTPAFVASSTPASGATSTPAFGSTSTPTFGNTGSASGASSSSVFSSSTPAFGAPSTPAFGASRTPAFGASSSPAFGGTSSSFSFWPSPTFSQSTSASGSSPSGATSSAFGAQSSPFGGQTTTPAFGSPGFGQPSIGGQQHGGTRGTPYAQTPEDDSISGTWYVGKLQSISAMQAYKEKSQVELRWEDYQLGDKGGPNPAARSSSKMSFKMNNTQQTIPLASSSPAFGQSSANLFSSTTSTNPSLGYSFGPATSNTIGSTPSPSPSPSPAPSAFESTPAFGSTSAFPSSPWFQSTTPTIGQTCSPFRQTPSAFGQAAPSFGQSAPAFGHSNAFAGNMFSWTPPLPSTSSMGFDQRTYVQPSFSTPFQSTQPTQNTCRICSKAQLGGTSCIFGINTFRQPSASQSPFTNPFGTLPAFPQMSSGRGVDKPAPMRISCALTSRHLSQMTTGWPARQYHPINEVPKVPFFNTSSTAPVFVQPSFIAQQHGLTRVIPYAPTPVAHDGNRTHLTQPDGNVESISAMPAYKDKSHEELKWADYQLGDQGGPILLLNLFVEWSLI